jgi:predicted DNA-binding transcriptional regulator YafY
MPSVKNQYLRYRILNSCFTNRQKQYWSIPELIKKLGEHDIIVDRRTLERDFEAMRHDEQLGYKAPIAYDKKEKAFYYSNPRFTIDATPLNTEDINALTLATNILQQYKGVQLVQQFEGVVDKLSKFVDHLRKPEDQKIIAFEKSPYYKGNDFFDPVLYAITSKQPLRITYRKFAGDHDDVHVLHPYFMKEYRGRWYVLGYSEARESIITLGLDRIIKMDQSNVSFKENRALKPKEYFQHTLGITLGKGPVEEIELWFSSAQAPYIKTQHLHHTQKTIRDDNDGLVISLKLIPNPELTQLLLSYGADVKVVKPKSLGDSLKQIWEKALKAS